MPAPSITSRAEAEGRTDVPFAYPATFWRALWAYPAAHAVLTLALSFASSGHPKPRTLRGDAERALLRDAAQTALKLISSAHAIFATYMAATDLSSQVWTKRNLIHARSELSNAAVGLEAGYLLQDTIISALLDSRYSPVRMLTPGAQGPFKIRFAALLKWHHIVLGGLLTLFLEFARHARDKGVFFVEGFVLMNASTPFLNLRWWLGRLLRSSNSASRLRWIQAASAANEVTLIATFFACRIGLIIYMLRLYGIRTKQSILGSYLSIPIQCKSGTALLVLLNFTWWLSLVQKSLKSQKAVQSR